MSLPHRCLAADLSAARLFKENSLEAVEVLSKNAGGAQSTIVRCSDGEFYVLKMNRNPQGSRVLINEAIGSLHLDGLGFTTPTPRRIWVGQRMIDKNPLLSFEGSTGSYPPEGGFHFGSLFIPYSQTSDEAAPNCLINNRSEITGITLFDVWANHTDRRQYLYNYDLRKRQSTISFIDHGHLFGGPEWQDNMSTYWVSKHLKRPHLDDPALITWIQRFKQVLPALLEGVAVAVDSVWTTGKTAEFIRCFHNRLKVLEMFVTSHPVPYILLSLIRLAADLSYRMTIEVRRAVRATVHRSAASNDLTGSGDVAGQRAGSLTEQSVLTICAGPLVSNPSSRKPCSSSAAEHPRGRVVSLTRTTASPSLARHRLVSCSVRMRRQHRPSQQKLPGPKHDPHRDPFPGQVCNRAPVAAVHPG